MRSRTNPCNLTVPIQNNKFLGHDVYLSLNPCLIMANNQFDVLTRPQRILTGLILLLAVDLIWVASSEFTKYIFKDLDYDKPFFSTYFKTSLFMIYLTGFLSYKPWRDQCRNGTWRGQDGGRQRRRRYERVNSSDHGDHVHVSDDQDEDDDDNPVQAAAMESDERSTLSHSSSFVGSPTYVPANLPPDSSGKSSGAESDGGSGDTDRIRMNGNGGISSASRRVRFKNVAQVVEMHPADALYANLARLSYNASLRAQAALRRAASRLSISEVIQLALLFCVPWFLGNYCYQEALSETEVAVVNVLSSSSCLFTLILSAIFPSEESDRFTLSKLFAVCFSITGVVLVSYSDLDFETGGSVPAGAIWTLVGAFFYAVYIVLLRRRVNHEDNMDSPMFFGFVGLFNALLLWPGLFLLHLTHKESFEIPTVTQFQFLILNGLLGTVLSEILWLWGCFYTSSLVATLAISLTIPLSILADIIWRGKTYGPIFFVGAIPMFFSFFLVAMLTHYEGWDPLMDLCRAVSKKCRGLFDPAARNNYVFDRHERESLINQQDHSTSQDESI